MLRNSGRKKARSCHGQRRTALLIGAVVTVLPLVQIVGAGTASALTYDYTDPAQTGCSSTGVNELQPSGLYANGYYYATLTMRYSTGCRTVWSKLYDFESDNAQIISYPWVNRTLSGDTWGDTWGWSAMCEQFGDLYEDYTYSVQLYDGGQESDAWGGVINNPPNECSAGNLISYTEVGPF